MPVVNWLCEVLKSPCTVEEDSEDSESESESESNTDGEDFDACTAARDPKGFASSSFDASLGRASRLCLAPNATGLTPLMLASMEGHEAVVESILDHKHGSVISSVLRRAFWATHYDAIDYEY